LTSTTTSYIFQWFVTPVLQLSGDYLTSDQNIIFSQGTSKLLLPRFIPLLWEAK